MGITIVIHMVSHNLLEKYQRDHKQLGCIPDL